MLYGLMLDRMGLSVRNGWLDSEGRVYIYFTLDDALAMLGCGKDKAVRLFKELDVSGGIGLIERRKQGQGRRESTSRTSLCRQTPKNVRPLKLQRSRRRRLLKNRSLDFWELPKS